MYRYNNYYKLTCIEYKYHSTEQSHFVETATGLRQPSPHHGPQDKAHTGSGIKRPQNPRLVRLGGHLRQV